MSSAGTGVTLLSPLERSAESNPHAEAAREVMTATRLEVTRLNGGNPGLGNFPDNPVYRRVRQDPIVSILSNQGAITIGYPDPLNAIPTILDMRRRQSEFGRYAETAMTFRLVDRGSSGESNKALDKVAALHAHVTGELTQDVGPYPAGTRYSAFDPTRMRWTMACQGLAEQAVFEALYGPLSLVEREALWQGRVRNAALFGLSPDQAPATHQECGRYVKDRYQNGELYLIEAAKFLGRRACLEATSPRWVVPVRELLKEALLPMLPEETREMFGITYGAKEQRGARRAIRTLSSPKMRALMRRIPDLDVRIYHMSAREEQRRRAAGHPPHIPDPYDTSPIQR